MRALQTIKESPKLAETRNAVRHLLTKIEKLDSVLLTEIWSKILSS